MNERTDHCGNVERGCTFFVDCRCECPDCPRPRAEAARERLPMIHRNALEDFVVEVMVPRDLTKREAARLGRWLDAIAIEEPALTAADEKKEETHRAPRS